MEITVADAVKIAQDSLSYNQYISPNVRYVGFEVEAEKLANLYMEYKELRDKIVIEFKAIQAEAKVGGGYYAYTDAEATIENEIFAEFQWAKPCASSRSRCLQEIRMVRKLSKQLKTAYAAWKGAKQ